MGTFIVLAIVILGAGLAGRAMWNRPSCFGKGGFFFLLKRMIGHENKPYGSLPCTSPQ